jgi:hypothetical protein
MGDKKVFDLVAQVWCWYQIETVQLANNKANYTVKCRGEKTNICLMQQIYTRLITPQI